MTSSYHFDNIFVNIHISPNNRIMGIIKIYAERAVEKCARCNFLALGIHAFLGFWTSQGK